MSMDDKPRVVRPSVNGKNKYARILVMNKYPLPNEDTDPLNAIAMYARYGMMHLRGGEINRGYTALSNILCELSRMDVVYNDSDEPVKLDCEQLHELDLENDSIVLLHRSMLFPSESIALKKETTTNKNKE